MDFFTRAAALGWGLLCVVKTERRVDVFVALAWFPHCLWLAVMWKPKLEIVPSAVCTELQICQFLSKGQEKKKGEGRLKAAC